jgi:hypothetical protein
VPSAARSRPPARFAFALIHALALAGGGAVIASIFLRWEDLTFRGRHQTATAPHVALRLLIDYTTKSKSPSLVPILAFSAALILIGVLLPPKIRGGRVLALLGAAVAVATAGMYGYQIHQLLHALHISRQVSVTQFVGLGPYVAAGGGGLTLLGILLSIPVSARAERAAGPAPPANAPLVARGP